jgi:glycosyltransferase involved in cell wall biosynthesis
MKVLLVCNGFPPSGQWGTEYYAHQLAQGLLHRGMQVDVFYPVRRVEARPSEHTFLERERFDVHREDRDGLRVFELTNGGDPKKSFRDSYRCEGVERSFAQLLEEEKPDVVHFLHLLWGLSVGLPAIAKAAGARTVVTPTDLGLICHRGQLFNNLSTHCDNAKDAQTCARCIREPGNWDTPPLRTHLRRMAVRGLASVGGGGRVVMAADIEARKRSILEAAQHVDHWILPTQTLERELRSHGLPMEHVTRMAYGIDERLYRLKREPAGSSTRFVYMSQYMPHKGLACLMAAVRLLDQRLPTSVEPWTVNLHGNGSQDRQRMYAKQILSDLPRRVRDCGPFEPLRAPEVLARTDCVLVPSLWRENAPLTILQARCAGVPVIASAVPGVSEVLEHGKHGLLFPPGEAGQLADAMARVIAGEFDGLVADPLLTHGEHLDAMEGIYGVPQLTPRSPQARVQHS